jgi:phosphoglycerate dehydrogenase-like enzyme
LPALLGRGEILICLQPLTVETEGILNAGTSHPLSKRAELITPAVAVTSARV